MKNNECLMCTVLQQQHSIILKKKQLWVPKSDTAPVFGKSSVQCNDFRRESLNVNHVKDSEKTS